MLPFVSEYFVYCFLSKNSRTKMNRLDFCLLFDTCVKLGPHIKGKTGSDGLRSGWYGRHVGFVNR